VSSAFSDVKRGGYGVFVVRFFTLRAVVSFGRFWLHWFHIPLKELDNGTGFISGT